MGRTLRLCLPLIDEQITAIVVAAEAFGVEPWELAVHALAFRQTLKTIPCS